MYKVHKLLFTETTPCTYFGMHNGIGGMESLRATNKAVSNTKANNNYINRVQTLIVIYNWICIKTNSNQEQ